MSFPVYNGRLSVGDDVVIGEESGTKSMVVMGRSVGMSAMVVEGGSVGASALGVRR